MKKLLLMLCLFTFMVPTLTSAHTGLESSNPTEGEVVKEELKEITLQYKTEIENLSTMKIVKDDRQEVKLDSVIIQEKTMSGILPQSLENGSYTIDWKIIGTDGHPIEGQIPFNVQVEQKEEEVNPPIPKETDKNSDKQTDEEKASTKEKSKKDDGFSPIFFMTIGFILGAIVFFIRIKKMKI
jgi:copper resistance protein C